MPDVRHGVSGQVGCVVPRACVGALRIGENTGVHGCGKSGAASSVAEVTWTGCHGWVMTSVQAATCGSR